MKFLFPTFATQDEQEHLYDEHEPPLAQANRRLDTNIDH